MSILRRIQQMRASLSGGSFLLEASGDLAAGDVLLIVKTSGAHQELPEEVTALLPKDPADYGRGTDIKAIAPAKTEVKVDGGTWTFKGFDKDSKKATMENADDDGNVKFTGTWEFTPKNPDPLPSTGGMGTHLFIIVGAALMAAAAIAFVRNSKNSNKTK